MHLTNLLFCFAVFLCEVLIAWYCCRHAEAATASGGEEAGSGAKEAGSGTEEASSGSQEANYR